MRSPGQRFMVCKQLQNIKIMTMQMKLASQIVSRLVHLGRDISSFHMCSRHTFITKFYDSLQFLCYFKLQVHFNPNFTIFMILCHSLMPDVWIPVEIKQFLDRGLEVSHMLHHFASHYYLLLTFFQSVGDTPSPPPITVRGN